MGFRRLRVALSRMYGITVQLAVRRWRLVKAAAVEVTSLIGEVRAASDGGLPMALTLIAAGHQVTSFDRLRRCHNRVCVTFELALFAEDS